MIPRHAEAPVRPLLRSTHSGYRDQRPTAPPRQAAPRRAHAATAPPRTSTTAGATHVRTARVQSSYTRCSPSAGLFNTRISVGPHSARYAPGRAVDAKTLNRWTASVRARRLPGISLARARRYEVVGKAPRDFEASADEEGFRITVVDGTSLRQVGRVPATGALAVEQDTPTARCASPGTLCFLVVTARAK